MIEVSSAGLAGTALVADQLSLLVNIEERLCRSYCVNSSIQPQYSVMYTAGTPVLNGTSVFIPITAVVTIVTPGCKCAATTQLFNEEFTVAFQGQTAVPTSVTIASVGKTSAPASVKCCKASAYSICDSITVAIA